MEGNGKNHNVTKSGQKGEKKEGKGGKKGGKKRGKYAIRGKSKTNSGTLWKDGRLSPVRYLLNYLLKIYYDYEKMWGRGENIYSVGVFY